MLCPRRLWVVHKRCGVCRPFLGWFEGFLQLVRSSLEQKLREQVGLRWQIARAAIRIGWIRAAKEQRLPGRESQDSCCHVGAVRRFGAIPPKSEGSDMTLEFKQA